MFIWIYYTITKANCISHSRETQFWIAKQTKGVTGSSSAFHADSEKFQQLRFCWFPRIRGSNEAETFRNREKKKKNKDWGPSLSKRTIPRRGRSAPFSVHLSFQPAIPTGICHAATWSQSSNRCHFYRLAFKQVQKNLEQRLQVLCPPTHESPPFLLFLGTNPPSFTIQPHGLGTSNPHTCLSRTHEVLLSFYHQAEHRKPFKDLGSQHLHLEGESAKRTLTLTFLIIISLKLPKEPQQVRGSPET